jgi:hypothetical protein
MPELISAYAHIAAIAVDLRAADSVEALEILQRSICERCVLRLTCAKSPATIARRPDVRQSKILHKHGD